MFSAKSKYLEELKPLSDDSTDLSVCSFIKGVHIVCSLIDSCAYINVVIIQQITKQVK